MSRHGPFPIAHPSTRNPWSGQPCSESVSSSASSQTYHVIPPNQYVQMEPYWEEGGPYVMGQSVRHPQEALLPQPGVATSIAPTGVYLMPKQNVPRHHFSVASESVGERRSRPDSSRAITPTSGHGGGTTETAVLPCGGHCVALETFCHHFLQVGFVAGILTGICLVVAGMVLGGSRNGDLGVLTYIGVLTSLVSALLLSIQCCSKTRPRQRRHRPVREEIPMRDLPPLQPLLTKIVHQQISHDQHQFREECGIPWWRRENPSAY
ncbi:uncharacterized protein LOC106666253 [Cimex lectularius]|uniref:Uncharacterized protein n=1 Tax=Cimex lectularius TaxID=79782 RepID=A0A8I6RRS4_CIMLE|nr:uncharacterized protein LOC106666253 [Cimex lectularius]